MSREAVVTTLQKILKNKEFFTEHKEQAFVNMLVLTTLRHLVFIKKTLKSFMKKKISSSASYAEYALYAASAEILYMDSPDYAVINSYVDLIKKNTDKYIAGFANAVLRKLTQNKEDILSKDNGEIFPPEFYKILNKDYNKSTISQIEKSLTKEPFTDITVKEKADFWATELNGKKLDDTSIRLPHGVKIPQLKGFTEGKWWVQDFAASLAVKTLGNIKGLKALDICAAPGGKTAQLIHNGAKVTALDISETRLKTLEENLKRLNLSADKIICADGIEFLKTTNEKYDVILLDAPCSATGTIRRHPEIIHIKTIADINKQTQLQKDFLDVTSNALNTGGILLYCVCSITKAEGEKQIETFLSQNKMFTLEESVRTLPHEDMDSFYIARLRKASS
ncbi:MAG: RsmB/NOP family class I SAM-dependent RNA methyltransferase [Lactobacillus sp.]|jgi:16S rRNA (cytosine967-C5)-methyltransferase|nr:RsmB/NOP family class I SAM-dependent RNA methyltransferase [Lactobacillus sp.]